MRRDTPDIPSAPMAHFDPKAQKKPERLDYTGDAVVGIVLLPKQNYMPVTTGTNADPKRT